MNWEKRKVNKSAEEIAFQNAMEQYQEHFGVPYVIDFAGEARTTAEAIAEITRLIAENEKQPIPEYENDAVY